VSTVVVVIIVIGIFFLAGALVGAMAVYAYAARKAARAAKAAAQLDDPAGPSDGRPGHGTRWPF
jgi:hypothetical protein